MRLENRTLWARRDWSAHCDCDRIGFVCKGIRPHLEASRSSDPENLDREASTLIEAQKEMAGHLFSLLIREVGACGVRPRNLRSFHEPQSSDSEVLVGFTNISSITIT